MIVGTRYTQIAVLALLMLYAAVIDSSRSPQDESASASSSCLAVPTVTLHNGVEMPILSLGTAQLVQEHVKDPPSSFPSNFLGFLPERAHQQLELALQRGVRAFDTAHIYRSERPIGHVLAEWFRTDRLERKDVWITSKVFHPNSTRFSLSSLHLPDMTSLSPAQVTERVQRHFEDSLHDLGIGYVDLMLLHWPSQVGQGTSDSNRQRRLAAWHVLEAFYRKGWARAIGVSNFAPTHLEQLKQDGAKIVPMVNQFEASVLLQYPQVLDYCKKNGIVPQAYSPLGRGAIHLPPVVKEIAQKHGKDIGQVSFRYLYQHGYAITYLTNSEQRMVSNTEIFDFKLTADEMKTLDSLNRPDGSWGLPSPLDLE